MKWYIRYPFIVGLAVVCSHLYPSAETWFVLAFGLGVLMIAAIHEVKQEALTEIEEAEAEEEESTDEEID